MPAPRTSTGYRRSGNPEEHVPPDECAGVYPSGRRCIENGCITVLNRYNGGPWCLIHAARHEAELLAAEVEDFRASQARGRCEAFTRKGRPCDRERQAGSPFCPSHAHLREPVAAAA
jgi:hypothetical protein